MIRFLSRSICSWYWTKRRSASAIAPLRSLARTVAT